MKIPLGDIEESPARLGIELTDLEASLKHHGQLSSIKVRPHPLLPGKYKIIYGNRRYAAAKSLGWKEIEAEVVEASNEEALAIAFSENEDRKNFSDYEKGVLLQKIHIETGKSYSEIASLIGRSKAFVAQHIAMQSLFSDVDAPLDEKIRTLISLTEKHARVLARIEDPVERWNMAKWAVAANLCVRELERYVPKITRKPASTDTKFSVKKDEEEVNLVIMNLISGLNKKDFRPYSMSRSRRYYNLFDDFPPFNKMDRETADEHNCNVIRRIDQLKLKIEELETKVLRETALSTMYIRYSMLIGGEYHYARSRVTMVLSKEEQAGWKIIHEHWSLTEPIKLADTPRSTIVTTINP